MHLVVKHLYLHHFTNPGVVLFIVAGNQGSASDRLRPPDSREQVPLGGI